MSTYHKAGRQIKRCRGKQKGGIMVSCSENGNDRRLPYPEYITKECRDGGMRMRDFISSSYCLFSTTYKIHSNLVKEEEE